MQQVLYVLEANRIKAVGPKPFIILPCAIFVCKYFNFEMQKIYSICLNCEISCDLNLNAVHCFYCNGTAFFTSSGSNFTLTNEKW